LGEHHAAEELAEAETPQDLEKRQVTGAIRTDFILSAEIMAIALNELGQMSVGLQAAALALVALAITTGVYGVVAIIVKLDDVGLHMAQRRRPTTRRIGKFLVKSVPGLLKSLASIGTAAMLWVGGGILLHGFEQLGFTSIPHAIHDLSDAIGESFGRMDLVVTWLANAIGASILGLLIGGIIVVIVRQFTKHPEELIID
jgi:predicted DNA repair protein MutK